MDSQITVSLFLLAGLVITTPQGTLVPTATTQSFVTGPHTATTMIVSALHPSNTGKHNVNAKCTLLDNGSIEVYAKHFLSYIIVRGMYYKQKNTQLPPANTAGQ